MENNIVFFEDKIVAIGNGGVKEIHSDEVNNLATYYIKGDVLSLLLGLFEYSHGMQILGAGHNKYRVAYFAKTKEDFDKNFLKGFADKLSDGLTVTNLKSELVHKDLQYREMVDKYEKIKLKIKQPKKLTRLQKFLGL